MALAAYTAWGVLPLFWPLLRPAPAFEILAHRAAWSLLMAAAVFVGANWGIYIWGVTNGHVLETALGYFINPLVTVMAGVVLLGEKLARAKWVAIGIATIAVGILTVDYGRLPWIAMLLAFSFAAYGFLKKKAGVGAVEAFAIETATLVLPAVAYLVFRESAGVATFGHVIWWKSALLALSGAITAVPLLLFAGAANRIPLSTLGIVQYVSPTLQFACGVLVFREAMPPSRWVGFGLVWTALAIFVLDSARKRPLSPRDATV